MEMYLKGINVNIIYVCEIKTRNEDKWKIEKANEKKKQKTFSSAFK